MSDIRARYQLSKASSYGDKWFGQLEWEEFSSEEQAQLLPGGTRVQWIENEETCSGCGGGNLAHLRAGEVEGWQREVSGMVRNIVRWVRQELRSTDELILRP